jgi:hypothetical protein
MIARVCQSGHYAMSHLTILPTVLRDAEELARCLEALGHHPVWGGVLNGFADDCQSVVLQIDLGGEARLGWSRQQDGSLALVGDLQRLSRSKSAADLLGEITRRYATHRALKTIADHADGFVGCHVSMST